MVGVIFPTASTFLLFFIFLLFFQIVCWLILIELLTFGVLLFYLYIGNFVVFIL